MRGLELALCYWEETGKPSLNSKYGEVLERAAVGLVGPGSECYGFDDGISRDHDWGPAFCIWLGEEDFTIWGKSLARAYAVLPKEYAGYGPRIPLPGEEFRVGVSSRTVFYQRYTGLDHPPETVAEWRKLSSLSLGVCTNGAVFADPEGGFSRWRRQLIDYFPLPVRLRMAAEYCIGVSQSGQYNYPRSLKRGDRFASAYSLMKFCTDAMHLCYLLNRRYVPYYKWLHRGLSELPLLGPALASRFSAALEESEQTSQLIEWICTDLAEEMRRQGMIDQADPYLLVHAESIMKRLEEEGNG